MQRVLPLNLGMSLLVPWSSMLRGGNFFRQAPFETKGKQQLVCSGQQHGAKIVCTAAEQKSRVFTSKCIKIKEFINRAALLGTQATEALMHILKAKPQLKGMARSGPLMVKYHPIVSLDRAAVPKL